MTVAERDPAPSLRERLEVLLAEHEHAARGTEDRYLAAYLRACVSALDATRLRVTRALRRPGEHRAHRRPHGRGDHRPVSQAPLYREDPRPKVTEELVRLRAIAHTGYHVADSEKYSGKDW